MAFNPEQDEAETVYFPAASPAAIVCVPFVTFVQVIVPVTVDPVGLV